MFENEEGHAEPGIRQNPTPESPGKLQAAVSREAGLDSRVRILLRKCIAKGRDCRFDGTHSFRKECPSGEVVLAHAYCGALSCSYCGPRHVHILRNKINAAIRQHELLHCYSLTMRNRTDRPFDLLMGKLKVLKNGHKRETGENLRYIAVKSVGKLGRPHLHLLTDTNWSQRKIKQRWLQLTRATQVRKRANAQGDVDRLTNYMIINYLECFLARVRLKKITRSKGIDIAIRPGSRKDRPPSDWERRHVSTRSAASAAFGTQLDSYPINPSWVVVPPKESSDETSKEGSSEAKRSENPPGRGTLSVHAAVTDSAPKATGLEPAASPHHSQALPAKPGADGGAS